MRFRNFFISVLTVVLLCLSGTYALAANTETAAATTGVTPKMQAKLTSVQVPFVPNEGQINDARFKFYADTFAGTVFVANDGITYVLQKGDEGGWAVKEEFVGARALAPTAAGTPAAPVNYFIGNDSGKWRQNLPSYDEITLGEVYDRINVNLRAYGDNVEKLFTIAPGGDPSDIELKVTGVHKLSVNANGELELATSLGAVKMTHPAAFQFIGGKRVDVDVAYVVKGDIYGFTVGDYDHAYPLVIDPLLAATLLGGGDSDYAYAVAVDSSGNVYVAGNTKSDPFPGVAGGYDNTYGGNSQYDVFITKFNSSLTQLLAATYLGGSAADMANGLALDASGNVYVTGSTKSSNFPHPNGYSQTYNSGSGSSYDAFAAKLSGNLSQLLSATFIGGNKDDRAYAIGLDGQGNVYVSGYTKSADLVPSGVPGYRTTLNGTAGSTQDAFLAKISGDLDALATATYIGGNTVENVWSMAVKTGGNVYIAGDTFYSSSLTSPYPTTPGAYDTSITKTTYSTIGFVTEFSDISQAPTASTFLGSSDNTDSVKAIALDANGNVYVTGVTYGTDFPTTTGATKIGGTNYSDIFVTKLKGDLSGPLITSTLIGGTLDDQALAISVNSGVDVYIGGKTYSVTDFPTTTGAYPYAGTVDPFVTKLKGDLSGPLIASTLLGGSGTDQNLTSLALDAAGHVYAAGYTNSTDLAIVSGTQGSSDAFVAKFTSDLATPAAADNTVPIWTGGSKLEESHVTETGMTLTWSGADDNMVVTGYKLYSYQGTDMTNLQTSISVAGATYDVTGLTAGTPYTFKVEAGDAAGNWSSEGPSKTVTTAGTAPDTTKPTWPEKSLTATNITDTSLTLTWTPATDNVGVTGYEIFKGGVEFATVSSDVYTTVSGAVYYTYNVTNLAKSSPYTFKVEAGDANNNWSIDGPNVDVTTEAGADIASPIWPNNTILSYLPLTDTSIKLIWTNPATDNVDVAGYKIIMATSTSNDVPIDPVITTVAAPATNCDVTGLTIGQSYFFKIEAFDAAGNVSSNGPSNWFTPGGGLYLIGAYMTIISGSPPVSTTGTPIENSSSVPLKPMLKLLFSNNIVNDGVWGVNQNCFTLQDGSGNNVPISVTRISDTVNPGEKNSLFITPVSDLSPSTQYKIIISPSLMPKNLKGTMGYECDVLFTTASEVTGDETIAGNGSNKDLLITGSTPSGATVTVPDTVTDATLNVSSLMNSAPPAGKIETNGLPALTIVANTSPSSSVQIEIPAGTTVSADANTNWDGTINVPSVRSNNSVAVTPDSGKTATVSGVVEIGFGDVPLTFNQAVRIVFPGQTGKDIGYVRGVAFTKITNVLSEDSQAAGNALPESGDGKFDNDTDLIVWTKHFTEFVTYTQAGNGGGGSSDTTPPYWPDGSSLTGEKVGSDVELSWTQANDNVGVVGYKIFMDETEIKTVGSSPRIYKVLNVQGPHTFKVEAGDNAKLWSTDGPSQYVTGSGDKPLSYVSANLTTLSGSNSSDGEAVDGNTSVPVMPTIRLVFDKNITTDSIWPANESCFTMQDSNGARIEIKATRILNADNFAERQHVFITPTSGLSAGKMYKIIVSGNMVANNGNTLGTSKTITFTVAAGTSSNNTGGVVANPNAPTFTTGSGSVDPAVGATVGLGNDAKVVIPANALQGTSQVTVTVQQLTSPPATPAGFKIAGKVYEFTVGGQSTYTFDANVGITLSFDASAIGSGEVPAVYYYDQSQQEWVSLGGTVSGNTITINVNHFTKFTVFAVKEAVTPVVIIDIAGHWAEANIRKLVELKVLSGYSDGSFKPDDNITRAEFATILVKAFELTPQSGKVFTDTSNHWAKDNIATAASYGIVNGYEDGSFGPDDLITREQMAVMIVKAAKLEAVNEETTFADRQNISDWAKGAITTAVKNVIIKGYEDNNIKPQGSATRAEAVTIIVNALRLQIH